MDSGQFLYSVMKDTLDRELDRKRNLESKAISLIRLWVFLLTTFITVITFLMNYNSNAIRSLGSTNSLWLVFFIVILCIAAFVISRLLHLIIRMASTSLNISDKDEIDFKSDDIDGMILSEINSLYSGACKKLNCSIKDYDERNKEIGVSIKTSLPKINKLFAILFVILIFFTLSITTI